MVAGGAAVLAAGAIGALALALLLKPGPGIDRMVPDDAGLYATVYLDPSMPQKANLLRMAHHFPDLQSDAQLTQKLNDWVDQALKNTGLSFAKDVQPWLGSRLTAVGEFSSKPTGAVLIASRDDAAAQAALGRVRTSALGKALTWTQTVYQGVTLSVGTGPGTTSVYAYVDHTAVLADSEAIVQAIIDTDQGRRGRLLQTADYQATVALLPSDRLVLAYVNGPRLVTLLKSQASTRLKGSTQLNIPESAWRELEAFRGIGMTLAAGSDGLSGDIEVKIDSAKLDASLKSAIAQSARRNTLLSWIPQRAFGVLATNGLRSGVQSAIDQAGPLDAQVRDSLQQFGLLGNNGVIAHLTGDLALEVESPGSRAIGGAVLIGTSDAAGMQIFLTKLGTIAELAAPSTVGGSLTATPAQKSTYHGVTITSFPISGMGVTGLAPSFAVTQGVGIIASSPAEIRNLIDTHTAGTTVARSSTFSAVRAATFANPQNFLYVDVTETADAILSYVPPAERGTYDSTVAPNLAPVKAVMIASQGQSDRLSERIFVLIPN